MTLLADITGLGGVVLIAGAWLIREITGLIIKEISAHLGKIFYTSQKCGFFEKVELEDGTIVEALCSPDNKHYKSVGFKPVDRSLLDKDSSPLIIEGELINNTGKTALFVEPILEFVRTEDPNMTVQGPDIQVNGEITKTIAVPSHSYVKISIKVRILDSMLDSFSGTIPFLLVKTTSGRKRSFRLSSNSFYGKHVAWPKKGKKLIVIDDDELKQRLSQMEKRIL